MDRAVLLIEVTGFAVIGTMLVARVNEYPAGTEDGDKEKEKLVSEKAR